MYLPNSLIVQANTQPIYAGQSFNILVGYINNSGALVQLQNGQYTFQIYNNTNNNLIYTIPSNNIPVFTANIEGSYSIIISYKPSSSPTPLVNIFCFYAAIPLKMMNESKLFTILKQELPSSYNNNVDVNSGNYLDNYASVQVLNDMYNLMYSLINQQYPSNGYTTNWEYALNSTNNLFQNANDPGSVTNLLYQIPYNTGINRFELILFIAKYCYYWLGFPVVVYIDGQSNITIYTLNFGKQWVLGDPDYSILGTSTYLNSIRADLFPYLLLLFLLRIFPVQVRFTLNFTAVNPDSLYTNVGPTYFGDIRNVKAISYLGDALAPFNMIGYIPTSIIYEYWTLDSVYNSQLNVSTILG